VGRLSPQPLRSATASLAGIACVLGAGACFAVIDTITQHVVATVPALMALWARYFLQALVSTAMLAPHHGRALLRTRHPWLQLIRGLLLVSSTCFAILALRYMPVGELTAINMLTPMAVTVLAVTMLKERVLPAQWLFMTVGLVGALTIVRPGGAPFGWAPLLALGCVLVSASFQLLTSRLGRTELPAATHFHSVWIGAGVASLLLPFSWTVVESPLLWLLMLMMGALGAVGHFLLAVAFQRAPAASLMPYAYGQVGFAVLGGWLIFSHMPDQWSMLGIALIVAAGVANAWFNAMRVMAR
jgi:drug/metabolite transporter (DMT)-like permease